MLPWRDLVALYRLTENIKSRNTEARYNVAPTQTVPFVRLDVEGNQVVDDGRWWLVPHWAKEMPKATMFNARIETVDTSPAFRDAFKMRRCLIPADGFYEWTKADDGGKDPWLIHPPGGAPLCLRRPLGAQYKAGRHELHNHHRPVDRAHKPDPRPHADHP